jgi:hypothetical protein
MRLSSRVYRPLVAAVALTVPSASALAGDLAATQARTTQSLASGFTATGIGSLLYRAAPALAPDAVLNALIPAACRGKCASVKTTVLSDRRRATADNWRLDVFGDGTAAEFYDQAIADGAHAQGIDAGHKWTDSALESAGRTFIAGQLASVLPLGPGESIVPSSTSFRREWGQDTSGVQAEAVVANRIAFTRLIGGVPVVGSGSKVVVTFANDGSVESFRYDWPSYTAKTTTQSVVGTAGILSRLQQILALRHGTVPTSSAATPSPSGSFPLDLGSDFALERLECGYYDAGRAIANPTAAVQPGCFYNAVHSQVINGIVMRDAYSGAVPALGIVMADAKWPEAGIVLGRGSTGASAAPSGGSP